MFETPRQQAQTEMEHDATRARDAEAPGRPPTRRQLDGITVALLLLRGERRPRTRPEASELLDRLWAELDARP